jgi:hypothetical protein
VLVFVASTTSSPEMIVQDELIHSCLPGTPTTCSPNRREVAHLRLDSQGGCRDLDVIPTIADLLALIHPPIRTDGRSRSSRAAAFELHSATRNADVRPHRNGQRITSIVGLGAIGLALGRSHRAFGDLRMGLPIRGGARDGIAAADTSPSSRTRR